MFFLPPFSWAQPMCTPRETICNSSFTALNTFFKAHILQGPQHIFQGPQHISTFPRDMSAQEKAGRGTPAHLSGAGVGCQPGKTHLGCTKGQHVAPQGTSTGGSRDVTVRQVLRDGGNEIRRQIRPALRQLPAYGLPPRGGPVPERQLQFYTCCNS